MLPSPSPLPARWLARPVALAAFVAAQCLLATNAHAACPPAGHTLESLQALKTSEWKVADTAERHKLALAMQACLASPNPALRDELGFAALSGWMRGAQLDAATLHGIRSTQLQVLTAAADKGGFAQPFAALALAEVARVDRKQPFLSKEQRQELANAASAYMSAVRDYRGFDEKEGWRHAVAHASDWMLQLALNPALEKPQMDTMLAAIASQVAPTSHFYQYGEGERLMTPVFYLARRSEISSAEWDAWFVRLLAPQKKGPPTQASLALRHNLNGFLLPLYFSLQESSDSTLKQRVLPLVSRSLKLVE